MGYSSGLTRAEITVRNNIQRATARKLQALSSGFRSSQKKYLSMLLSQKKGALQGDDQFGFLADEERASKLAVNTLDLGFNEQQMAVLEDTEVLVEQRDQEIKNIQTSINELAVIFKELAVLVIDQGTILDRIDFNMEQLHSAFAPCLGHGCHPESRLTTCPGGRSHQGGGVSASEGGRASEGRPSHQVHCRPPLAHIPYAGAPRLEALLIMLFTKYPEGLDRQRAAYLLLLVTL
ncbi:unnamed protein product [Discosporangium mesarthrocarpum]